MAVTTYRVISFAGLNDNGRQLRLNAEASNGYRLLFVLDNYAYMEKVHYDITNDG